MSVSVVACPRNQPQVKVLSEVARPNRLLLIHESPLTDALFLLVSKSDEVTTT